jgi:hypothetical protein
MGANEADTWYKRLYYRLLSKLGKNLSYRLFFYFATFFKKPTGKRIMLTTGAKTLYGEYLDEDFENPIELQFEGRSFLAPPTWQNALQIHFPGWTRLPPMNHRAPHLHMMVDVGELFEMEKTL